MVGVQVEVARDSLLYQRRDDPMIEGNISVANIDG